MNLNATFSLGTSYEQQEQEDYADDVVDLRAEGFQEGGMEGEDADEFSQGDQVDYVNQVDQVDYVSQEDQVDFGSEMTDSFQDEVLDLQIHETLDAEFQVSPPCTCTDYIFLSSPYGGRWR